MKIAILTLLSLVSTQPLALPESKDPPALVSEFMLGMDQVSDQIEFNAAVREALWEVYPLGDQVSDELEEFVANGADGPDVAFAAISLIPFHDPSSVTTMMERARDEDLSTTTRWFLLNAAPYVLGMGDVMYLGDGFLTQQEIDKIEYLTRLAESALENGIGTAHALVLRELHEDSDAKAQSSEYGLALWHQSAYLIGTLDLADLDTLRPFVDPSNREVFSNVMSALSFAIGRDLLTELSEAGDQVTPELEQRVASETLEWWEEYLRSHPDGDWMPAARQSLAESGYVLPGDIDSDKGRQAILQAITDNDIALRFAAFRLLNHRYDTHFDLDRAFLGGKYALSFLDPSFEEQEVQARLREYWQDRLAP